MRRICVLAEPALAILERLGVNGPCRVGSEQFPYYLPDMASVASCCLQLSKVAACEGICVELISLADEDSVIRALGLIGPKTVFWPLTDGYLPFLGTPLIGLLRSFGAHVFGAGPMAAAASQNKLLQFGLFTALGLATPRTWLYRDDLKPPDHDGSFIAKPVDLGNSIGIFDDGMDCDWLSAKSAARRIREWYGREAIIQEYISGTYCRATFLGSGAAKGKRIGVHVLSHGAEELAPPLAAPDFGTYFAEFKRRDEDYNRVVTVRPLDAAAREGRVSAVAQERVLADLASLADHTDLAGVFSLDLIIADEIPYFIEVNTNPFIRNGAFRSLCEEEFGADVVTSLYRVLVEFLDGV